MAMAKRPDDGDRVDDPYIDESELSPAPSRASSFETASPATKSGASSLETAAPATNTQPVFEVEIDSGSEMLESLEKEGPQLFADREHEVMPELAEPSGGVASGSQSLARPLSESEGGPDHGASLGQGISQAAKPKETFMPSSPDNQARRSRLDALLKIVQAKMEASRVKLYCM